VLRGFIFRREIIDAVTCFHPNPLAVNQMAFGLLDNMISGGSNSSAAAGQAKRSQLPCYRPSGPRLESTGDWPWDAQLEDLRAEVEAGTPLVLR
jgi:hypothetical protein